MLSLGRLRVAHVIWQDLLIIIAMHCRFAAVSLLAFVAALPAQNCLYTGPVDPAAANLQTAGLPFAQIDYPTGTYRIQVMFDAIYFQNVPTLIRDIQVANRGLWSQTRYDSCRIRMGQSTNLTLDGTFANNITGPMTVVLEANGYSPYFGGGPRWCPLGLQQDFLFLPGQGNLLIDVELSGFEILGQSLGTWPGFVRGTSASAIRGTSQLPSPPPTSGTGVTTAAMRLCTDLASVGRYGTGCSGGAYEEPLIGVAGRPTLGGQPVFWLSNTTPSGVALLALAVDQTVPLTYPIDLTPFGADGCTQFFALTSAVGVGVDALGLGSHVVTIPNLSALTGTVVAGQFATLAPGANNFGLLTTSYVRLQVGL